MNVLSLFDGISCAYVALQRAGLPVQKYYASEIDKHAIAVSKVHVPCRIDIGDVRSVTALDDTVDLLVGGSPCQDLSIAKKGRQGLSGNRSSLFWEYVRIKDAVKPKWFILENVASMPKADKDTITQALGVEPIMINASLVSAQSRKRLFWTNIPNVALPEDRGILLKDILQPDAEVDDRFVVQCKSFCLTASYSKTSQNPKETEANHEAKKKQRTLVRQLTLLEKPKDHEFKQIGYFGAENENKVGGQALRVYTADGKSTTSGVGLYKIGHVEPNVQGNTVYSTEGKSATLTANGGGVGAKTGLYDVGRIRKLTPIECERLQCLPDDYTKGIAMTNRYKCLGNAFNVEVVAHILKSIPKE